MNLEIDNIKKVYGSKKAVNGVSSVLKPGLYGLLGANGAGKSTLMKIICGLIPMTSGGIRFEGKNIQLIYQDYYSKLGYLPQDFGFYPEFTVSDFLMYMGAIKGVERTILGKRVEEVIQLVALSDKKDKKIKTLSGGMKRRLGIAQAILNKPSVLVLDEPTTGLDPKERIRFRSLISEYSTESIILLSTHIVSDVESIANNILIMKDGQFISKGTPDELLQTMNGYVWECYVASNLVDKFQLTHKVSNVKIEDGIAICRVIENQKPVAEAHAIPPKLEDLYVFYFDEDSEEGGQL